MGFQFVFSEGAVKHLDILQYRGSIVMLGSISKHEQSTYDALILFCKLSMAHERTYSVDSARRHGRFLPRQASLAIVRAEENAQLIITTLIMTTAVGTATRRVLTIRWLHCVQHISKEDGSFFSLPGDVAARTSIEN